MAVLELVRHAMTRGNLEGRYLGTTDEGLCPRGKALARSCARPPEEIPRRVWVSPLCRCVETARLLYPGAELVPAADLGETDFGLFENKRYEDLKDLPAYQKWLDTGGRSGIPGGEDRAAFEARCAAAFARAAGELLASGEERGAVVAHGGVLMALCAAHALPERDFYDWQSPCCGGWLAVLDPELWAGTGKFVVLGPILPRGEEGTP